MTGRYKRTVMTAFFCLFGGQVAFRTAAKLHEEGLLCRGAGLDLVTVVQEQYKGIGGSGIPVLDYLYSYTGSMCLHKLLGAGLLIKFQQQLQNPFGTDFQFFPFENSGIQRHLQPFWVSGSHF